MLQADEAFCIGPAQSAESYVRTTTDRLVGISEPFVTAKDRQDHRGLPP